MNVPLFFSLFYSSTWIFWAPHLFCSLGEQKAALSLGSCRNSLGTLGVLPQNAVLTWAPMLQGRLEAQHSKGHIMPRCTVSPAESWQLVPLALPSLCQAAELNVSTSPSVLGPGSILWCLFCCLLQNPRCKREGNPATIPCNVLEGVGSCSLSSSSDEPRMGFLHQQGWNCHGDG